MYITEAQFTLQYRAAMYSTEGQFKNRGSTYGIEAQCTVQRLSVHNSTEAQYTVQRLTVDYICLVYSTAPQCTLLTLSVQCKSSVYSKEALLCFMVLWS